MSDRESQINQFHQIYQALNLEQRKAVDAIEGPVMVIAGPGTGKTQILSARIGKILLETDTQAENILCLTYTDAGAVAMRRRLLSFIGADAYKVNINTFHSFCNDIIQENLSLFHKNELEAISELESIDLFKTLIDGFKAGNPLKRYRGDVYYELKALKQLFGNMKKEGWTAEYIIEKIDLYLHDLPNRDAYVYQRKYKQFNAGDLKQSKIDEETEKMNKLRAAVLEFDRYDQLMKDRSRYDFDDMIIWVLKAFQENSLLLSRYQERYLYILVDEYQDTSGTQNLLVDLLINFWEQPNVFVVGDDDQSIYRFQGANVENMESFVKKFKDDLASIVLTNNYRSTQPILDISKSLIEKNQERLIYHLEGLSKELIASNKEMQGIQETPAIIAYETQKHEMIDVTRQVTQLISEGVTPGNIAIIYKENKYGEELARFFSKNNLPIYSKKSQNLLDILLVKKILTVLSYLAAELETPNGGDEYLFEILHYHWFNIPPIEIAKLSLEASNKKEDKKNSIRKLLFNKVNQPSADLFSPPIPEGMKLASNGLESLLADASNLTLVNLIEQVFTKLGILKWVMGAPDKHEQLKVLSTFFDFIKEEAHRNHRLNLKKLMNIFELMEKEKIHLPVTQVNGNEKGINFLTVHGSKGLEFEYVFFVGCNAKNWEKKRVQKNGFSFPDTLFLSAPNFTEIEELRRLFFVAITRAKKHLKISFSLFQENGKDQEASMFIAEIQDAHAIPTQSVVLAESILMDYTMIDLATDKRPELANAESDFINAIVENYQMNVTALNSYLKCPIQFYFQNLVRVPSGKSENTEFGSAIHFALQTLFEKMKQTNEFPSKQETILFFEHYMNQHRESFTQEQFARRMEYGSKILDQYYDQNIHSWNKVVLIENMITRVVVGGVPLKGKLDKLEFNGNQTTVVDYKTGNIDNAKLKLQGPNAKEPNGGDYWRQAVFYKLLVDNYQSKNWQVTSCVFDFVEPDKKDQYQKINLVISPEDLTTVTQQIKMVWDKIKKHDFYTGCGKPECHWCNFAKDNQMAIALHDAELNESAD